MTETIGEPLDDFEIEEFLESRGLGVLGLARDGTAYTIPIAVAYDADRHRCILRFVMDADSKKRDFVAATETASLTVYQWDSPGAWRSVVLAGTLAVIDSEDVAQAAAVFSDIGEEAALDIFARPLDEFETTWYSFEIEAISGRGAM